MTWTKWESLGGGMEVLTSPAHRVGTDALLLASFSGPRRGELVCDLGTGCGMIPFYWFREGWQGTVTAIDIQEDAVQLAQESVRRNGLEGRMQVLCGDLRNLPKPLIGGSFDRVTCNPPYFADGAGRQSREEGRRTARHETKCSIEDIARAAGRLLRFGGWFFLCQRPQRLCGCLDAMRWAGIEPKRLRFCHHRADREPFLVLMAGKKGASPGLQVESPLFVKGPDGQDSVEMKNIYKGICKEEG